METGSYGTIRKAVVNQDDERGDSSEFADHAGRLQPAPDPLARWIDGAELDPSIYARRLVREMAERHENPVTLSEDQIDFVAVVTQQVSDLLNARRAKHDSGDPSPPAPAVGATNVSVDAPPPEQMVILLHGQGGSGKTEVVKILRQVFARFGLEDFAVASSNSAARVIEGETIHSAVHLHGESSLKLGAMDGGVTDELVAQFENVDVLIVEEVSMIQPRLLGAISI